MLHIPSSIQVRLDVLINNSGCEKCGCDVTPIALHFHALRDIQLSFVTDTSQDTDQITHSDINVTSQKEWKQTAEFEEPNMK